MKDKKKKNIMDFFGIWKNDSDYWKNFNKKIRKNRDKNKLRTIRL